MLLLVRIITVQKLVAKSFFIFVACLFVFSTQWRVHTALHDQAVTVTVSPPTQWRVHTALHDQAVTVTVSPPPPVCLCTVLFHFCLFLSCGSFLLSVQHCNSNCTTTSTCLFMYSFHFISVTLLYRSFLLSVQHFHSHLSLSLVLPVDTNIGITFH